LRDVIGGVAGGTSTVLVSIIVFAIIGCRKRKKEGNVILLNLCVQRAFNLFFQVIIVTFILLIYVLNI